MSFCRNIFFSTAPGLAELFESLPSSGDILVPIEDLDIGKKSSKRQEVKERVRKVVESESGESDSESDSGVAPVSSQAVVPTREKHARGSKQAAQARIAKCIDADENLENYQNPAALEC